MNYTVHGILQARILEWVAFPFPTQGSNPDLPHCRQILYQLSHKGNSSIEKENKKPISQMNIVAKIINIKKQNSTHLKDHTP